ncbi:MAG: hypothetical protein HZB38_07570 [Planctomycetes bacterium]|nr:hypothetical protein [Planctomycetota bacterium]
MADLPDLPKRFEPESSRAIAQVLTVAAGIGAIAVAFGLAASVWSLVQQPSESANVTEFLVRIALLVIGLVFCALVWGVSELLRHVETSVRNDATMLANTSVAAAMRQTPAAASADSADSLNELVVLLREVRDISLLNDSQRTKRLEAQSRAAVEVLLREVPVLLREHNWIEARNRVQEARERFPSVPDWDAMERQIEQMRSQVEQHDLEAAERQIADLTNLAAWDRVAEVVKELLQRHPGSAKAIELAQRVRASRNKIEVEQRSRLMAQAQDATRQRDWKSAYALALQVIERYPKSPDAQALRLQLPTLRENAEIQARQRLESEIRDLVREHRYGEAIRMAGDVIQQYPNSPQAEVLREQLPKLQERAATVGVR